MPWYCQHLKVKFKVVQPSPHFRLETQRLPSAKPFRQQRSSHKTTRYTQSGLFISLVLVFRHANGPVVFQAKTRSVYCLWRRRSFRQINTSINLPSTTFKIWHTGSIDEISWYLLHCVKTWTNASQQCAVGLITVYMYRSYHWNRSINWQIFTKGDWNGRSCYSFVIQCKSVGEHVCEGVSQMGDRSEAHNLLQSLLRTSMRQKLQSGITILADRYAYSGVAYSAAKVSLANGGLLCSCWKLSSSRLLADEGGQCRDLIYNGAKLQTKGW